MFLNHFEMGLTQKLQMCIDFKQRCETRTHACRACVWVGGVRRQPYGSALNPRSFGVKNKSECDMYALESDTYWPARRARQTAQWPPPPPSGWAPGPGWGSLWGTAATCDSSLRAGRTTGGSRSGLLPRLCRHKQHVNVPTFKGLSCGNSSSDKRQHTIGSLQVHTSVYKKTFGWAMPPRRRRGVITAQHRGEKQ